MRKSIHSFLILVVVLMGCSKKQIDKSVPFQLPDSFSYSGADRMPQHWWTSFGDDTLNALIDTMLASNFDLKVAWERLNASRAIADRVNSRLFPSLEASAEAGISQSQSEFAETNHFRLGLSSSYEIDLWGRIRSRVDAERLRAEAGYSEFQTAALTLSAEFTRTWFQLIESRQQYSLIQEQVEINKKMVQLIKARFGSGQVRSVDILRQQQLLESSREQQILMEAEMEVLQHRLV